jgi:hypothetical protein
MNLFEDEIRVLNFYLLLSRKEYRKFSQHGEDGVINYLINFIHLGSKNYSGVFVEFGTQNATETNTRFLKEKRKWSGLLMDGFNENLTSNLHKENITHENIVRLFKKYSVPVEFDLFSEDTDYADYWIMEQVLTEYRPKIVVHEVNQLPPKLCVTVPKPTNLTFWKGTMYYGGNVCAFYCLAQRFNYTMVYCESIGVNCFWLRNDLLTRYLKVEASFFQKIINPPRLYRRPRFAHKPSNETSWFHVNCTF